MSRFVSLDELKPDQNANNLQIGRNDEHIDKKVELVSRGFQSKLAHKERRIGTLELTSISSI